MPRDYIPIATDRSVREAFGQRCAYCHSPQHLVMGRLEIEHIIPVSRGGGSAEENLALSCSICNRYKGDRVLGVDPVTGASETLFNPRAQNWSEHFRWSNDGLRILGITSVGRATVAALRLDSDPEAIIVPSYWVRVGWHPPPEDAASHS